MTCDIRMTLHNYRSLVQNIENRLKSATKISQEVWLLSLVLDSLYEFI